MANLAGARRRIVGESPSVGIEASHVYDTLEPVSWLVKTTETLRLAPRTRQTVVGRLDLQKSRASPGLVCVEPAHLPFEGILVARAVSRGIVPAQEGGPPRVLSALPAGSRVQEHRRAGPLVHVMVVNFSREEVELPKATVLGVAEEIAESLVATVNNGDSETPKSTLAETRCDPSFRKYLDEKLGHLSPTERKVIEPVLVNHRKGFYREGS